MQTFTVQPWLHRLPARPGRDGLADLSDLPPEVGTIRIDAHRQKPSAWRAGFRRAIAAWRNLFLRWLPLAVTAALILVSPISRTPPRRTSDPGRAGHGAEPQTTDPGRRRQQGRHHEGQEGSAPPVRDRRQGPHARAERAPRGRGQGARCVRGGRRDDRGQPRARPPAAGRRAPRAGAPDDRRRPRDRETVGPGAPQRRHAGDARGSQPGRAGRVRHRRQERDEWHGIRPAPLGGRHGNGDCRPVRRRLRGPAGSRGRDRARDVRDRRPARPGGCAHDHAATPSPTTSSTKPRAPTARARAASATTGSTRAPRRPPRRPSSRASNSSCARSARSAT